MGSKNVITRFGWKKVGKFTIFDQLRDMNLNNFIRLIYEDTKGVSFRVKCRKLRRNCTLGTSWQKVEQKRQETCSRALKFVRADGLCTNILRLWRKERGLCGNSFGKASNIFLFFFFFFLRSKEPSSSIEQFTRDHNLVIIRFQIDPAFSVDNKYYRASIGE